MLYSEIQATHSAQTGDRKESCCKLVQVNSILSESYYAPQANFLHLKNLVEYLEKLLNSVRAGKYQDIFQMIRRQN